jgi:4-hydroxy-tetrahydrodipicolinate synthase
MRAKFITPAVTAFDKDGRLDREANRNVYEYLIANGMDGIAVLGSTGEFFAMKPAMRKELARLAVETVNKRTKVIVGTCSMCMEETLELTRHACDTGADAVILISPYYFKLSDESIELYYDTVASGTPIDIVLYNFPDRTGYDLKPSITLNLLRKHRNIVGYKDTVSGMSHTRALIETVRGEFPAFEVYSGFEENFAYNVLSGGFGCIGGLSNFAAELFSGWAKAVNAKDFDRVTEIQQTVNALSALYEVATPFVPVVKKAMMLKGLKLDDYCSAPLMRANEEQTKQIREILTKLDMM